MTAPIAAVVVGATGYVGGELLRLIADHPVFELQAAVSSSRAGEPVAALYPGLAGVWSDRRFQSLDEALAGCPTDARLALFSAAPHGASAGLVDALLGAAGSASLQAHAVDASADFRFDSAAQFAEVYDTAHPAPDLLEQFTCAVPEHLQTWSTPHVGHPGCFATAMALAVVPLFDAELAEPDVFVTAVTGSTGSGRSPGAGTHHPERHANLYAYKALGHRHVPEVAGLVRAATGKSVELHFVPHSGPFARGIYLTAQATLSPGASLADVRAAFESRYADARFVRLRDAMPRLKDVVLSNRCDIGIAGRGRQVVITATLDNLVKGAAGGAIQWMNRLFDLPEHSGLSARSPAWI